MEWSCIKLPNKKHILSLIGLLDGNGIDSWAYHNEDMVVYDAHTNGQVRRIDDSDLTLLENPLENPPETLNKSMRRQ